jgi:collagenase-like PrtC family protease
VTVANPVYLREIRSRFPDLEICASVLADIDSVQRALIFRRLGADVITPDVSINRNLRLLEDIKAATGARLKLMVNEGCLYRCPFRKFHFNYISHKSSELGEVEPDVFFGNCGEVIRNDNSQILKSGWVRPEDARKYEGITAFFKIVGRARPRSMVVRTVRAYLSESWDGDLLDIVSSSLNRFALDHGAYLDNKSLGRNHFFDKVTSCDMDCRRCGFCEDLAARLLKINVPTRAKLEDMGLSELADSLEARGHLAGNLFEE